jgi:phage terminase Nu1 subunit (DNA packaging protein)
MKSIIIPVHSFVDLITNSSSEVFITADENTVAAVRQLIDSLLKVAGSTKTSRELFDVDVVSKYYNKTKEEIDAEVLKGDFDEDEARYIFEGGDNPPKTNIRVTAKVDTPETQAAAKALSDLTGMFAIEVGYD